MSLSFPDPSGGAPGDKYEVGGILYQWKVVGGKGYWTSVAPPYTEPSDLGWVLKAGDTMTGTLNCPNYVGNYGIDELDVLSP